MRRFRPGDRWLALEQVRSGVVSRSNDPESFRVIAESGAENQASQPIAFTTQDTGDREEGASASLPGFVECWGTRCVESGHLLFQVQIEDAESPRPFANHANGDASLCAARVFAVAVRTKRRGCAFASTHAIAKVTCASWAYGGATRWR